MICITTKKYYLERKESEKLAKYISKMFGIENVNHVEVSYDNEEKCFRADITSRDVNGIGRINNDK